MGFSRFLVGFWDFCRYFQFAFWTFAGFQVGFGVLSGILDGQQVVSVGILGFSRFLVGFWDFAGIFSSHFGPLQVFKVFFGFFQVFKMASRLFQLVFWDFQDF